MTRPLAALAALVALASSPLAQSPLDFSNVVDVNQGPVPLGTHVDLDIHPDSGTLTPHPLSAFITDPQKGIVFQGRTFFFARTAEHGDELWSTDGTAAGTSRITDINPGPGHAFPRSFVEFQDKLYFAATNPKSGRELYVSDGTRQGTHLVGDILPGPGGVLQETWTEVERLTGRSNRIVVHQDKLYFRGWSAAQGDELWVSDGTAAGTQLFHEFAPGSTSGRPAYLTSTNQGLYFAAYTPGVGREVWRTDGTAAGTQQVSDVSFTTSNSTGPVGFTEVGSYVLFSAVPLNGQAKLYSTQGTLATTVQLGFAGNTAPDLVHTATLGGFAYFATRVNGKLYRTDGTVAGTQTVASLFPNDPGTLPRWITKVGDRAVYVAFDGTSYVLFGIDAQGVATKLGTAKLDHDQPLVTDGAFVYATGVGVQKAYRSDGTPGGTNLILTPWIPDTVRGMTTLAGGGALAFAEQPSTGVEPQIVPASGIVGSTLMELNTGVATAGSTVQNVAAIGSRDVYFAATIGNRTDVHRWNAQDGLVTVTGPSFPNTNNASDGVGRFTPLWDGAGLKVLFTGASSQAADQLWITDGQPNGAVRLMPNAFTGSVAWIENLVVAGDRAFITARSDFSSPPKLYTSDGTVNGTRLLDKFQAPGGPQPLGDPRLMIPYAGGVAFVDAGGNVLWSDGTVKGTKLLHAPVAGFNQPTDLGVANGKLGVISHKLSSKLSWELRAVDFRGSTALARLDKLFAPHVRFARVGPDLCFNFPLGNYYFRTDLTVNGTLQVGSSKATYVTMDYVRPIYVGTEPGFMMRQEWGNSAFFDGHDTLHAPHELLPESAKMLHDDGPRMLPAGGGLFFVDPGVFGEGRLSGGPIGGPQRHLWAHSELAELKSGADTLRDLFAIDGQLFMVYNDRYGKGEELYSAPLPYAYVRDIDVARTEFHIEASDPIVGQPFRVSGIGAPAFVPVVLFAGALRDTPVASGFGQLLAPDAPLWLDLGAAIPYALGVGPNWTQLSTLPDAPALLGLRVGLQAGYLDPKTNQIHASNALELGLGLGL